MVCITAHAVTGQLTINSRATSFGVLILFQYQHTRTVAEHKAIAINIPGSAGRFRVIVASRKRPCRTKARKPQRTSCHLRTTTHHGVSISVLYKPTSLTDIMCTCGTGSSNTNVRSLQTAHNRYISRDHVNDGRRHKERRHPTWSGIE